MPSELREIKRGEMPFADDWNKLCRIGKQWRFRPDGGVVFEGGDVQRDQVPFDARYVRVYTAVQIPAFSIFGITGVTPGTTTTTIYNVAQVGEFSDANPARLYTNEGTPIGADSEFRARPVAGNFPARIRVTGSSPTVGRFCGVQPDEWGVTDDRAGLICVGLDRYDEEGSAGSGSASDSGSQSQEYAYVQSALEAGLMVGVAIGSITGLTVSTLTVGSGTVRVLMLPDSSLQLMHALDPGTEQGSGDDPLSSDSQSSFGFGDWEEDIVNLTAASFSDGDVVTFGHVLGIGLAIIGGGGGGGGGGSNSCRKINGWDLISQFSDITLTSACKVLINDGTCVGWAPISLCPCTPSSSSSGGGG